MSEHAISFAHNALHIELCMVVLAVKHDIYHLTVSLVKCQEKEKSRGVCIELLPGSTLCSLIGISNGMAR